MFERKRGYLVLLLAGLCIIAGPAVLATDGGDPPVECSLELCLELSHECVDVAAVGAPTLTRGVVTNCGVDTLDQVTVQDLLDLGTETYVLDPVALAPGESAEYFSEFTPEDCPDSQSVQAHGVVFTPDNSKCRIKVEDTATCDCPTLTATCRTPGFWGTHAGTEKSRAMNITQAVIDAAPAGIVVCGETVDNTSLMTDGSALEAMCVHPRGEQIHQLARHLTAAALNCVMSGSGMDCDGTAIEGLFNSCNSVCMAGTDDQAIQDCGLEIDCWNNGGTLLDTGMCQLGTCSETGEPCEENLDCGYNLDGAELSCIPFKDTCHDRPLVNEDLGLFFDPPGPAGSSKGCNSAIKNKTYLLD